MSVSDFWPAISQVVALYALWFFTTEFRNARKQGLKGRELREAVFLNKGRAYLSGMCVLVVGIALLEMTAFSCMVYCSGRDFENESKFNKKLCYVQFAEQRERKQEYALSLKRQKDMLESQEKIAREELKYKYPRCRGGSYD